MKCHNHPLRSGVNTCHKCGHWLCDECSKERGGRIQCQECLVDSAGGVARYAERNEPNAFLLILFSALPGANYMYMGLIKRGLFALTAFFASIYMAGSFSFFGFVIPAVVITSFFDGLRIRRRFLAGESVSDDIDDVKRFFSANKIPIIGLTVLLIAMEMLQNAARWIHRGVWWTTGHGGGSHGSVIAIAAILLGIYFLSKGRKGKKFEDSGRSKSEYDMRN